MTVLGLKLSRRANAVSALHGEVSRAMWTGLFPGEARRRSPSGTSPTACTCRPGSRRRCRASTTATSASSGASTAASAQVWEGIENVDDGELWETHLILKARLHRVRAPAGRRAGQRTRNEPTETIARVSRMLSPDALTIGFARRFATYKRANLILRDLEALAAMVERPEAAGAVHLRRQGPSARRARQARAAGDRAADARADLRGQVRVRRGLRHQRRPASWCRASTCG